MYGLRRYIKRNGSEHARLLARDAGRVRTWREMQEFVIDNNLPHPLANELEDLFDQYRLTKQAKG